MKNILIIFLIFGLITAGCGDRKGNTSATEIASEKSGGELQLDVSELFHAEVNMEMTLLEVSKINSLSETYLKQKLVIPQYVKHPYTILELSRNYEFSSEDLKQIIEKFKNKKTLEIKKTLERNKEINK